MKKAIITLLTIIVLITALAGCTQVGAERQHRFVEIEEHNSMDWEYDEYRIFYDTKTGVEYVTFGFGRSASTTVLLNADGTPVLYKGE